MNHFFRNATQGKVSVFKRWSRTPFAVFQSLHKVVKISFIVNAVSLLTTPLVGYAQQDTIKINNHLEIDEVVVSAGRTAQQFSEMARIVTVIPASEIQSSAAASLQELLRFALNVDIRQRGANGVQADLSIRGGSFDQTLILLNGVPLSDPQTGHHNLNLPVDLESIERIEILHGPGTRVYGPNALSGAVNIITDSKAGKALQASVSGGQYGLFNGSLALNYQLGKWRNYINGAYKSSTGYTDNTDFKAYNFFYHGALETKFGDFDLQAGYVNKGFGAQSFYSQKYPEQYEQVRSKVASLGYLYQTGDLAIQAKVYGRRHHDRFELFREDRYAYADGYFVSANQDTAVYYPGVVADWNYYPHHNYHMTDVLGASSNATYGWQLGTTSFGMDYRYEHIFSNVLGETMAETVAAPGELRGVFDKEADRTHLNVFLEHHFYTPKFQATLGTLLHYNSAYKQFFTHGLDLSYVFDPKLKLFGSVNQSLRMPTFTDLYYSGPENIGNPDLKPELATSYEVGVKGYTRSLQYHVAGFVRETKDAIDWVKDPSESLYTTVNFTALTTRGVETSIKYKPQMERVNFVQLGYAFLNLTKAVQDSSVSAYGMDYLRHNLQASVDLKLADYIGLRMDYTLKNRLGSWTNTAAEEVAYAPIHLLDAKLYYRQPVFEFYVAGSNLFNKEFYDLGGVVQPGLWLTVGLKAKLDFKH